MTPRLLAVLSPFVLLAACGNAQPADDNATLTAEDIAGEWDVVRFGDWQPEFRIGESASRTAFVTFGAEGTGYRLGCNWSGSETTLGPDGMLRGPEDRSIESTAMYCEDLDELETEFFLFMKNGATVSRGEDGQLVLSKAGKELVLERPGQRRLAFVPTIEQLAGRWQPVQTAIVNERGMRGFAIDEGAVLTIGADALSFSPCPGYTVAVSFDDAAIATSKPSPEPTCPEFSERGEWVDGEARMLDAMRASPRFEKLAGGQMLMTAGENNFTLRRVD